jgi:hypothetical protein
MSLVNTTDLHSLAEHGVIDLLSDPAGCGSDERVMNKVEGESQRQFRGRQLDPQAAVAHRQSERFKVLADDRYGDLVSLVAKNPGKDEIDVRVGRLHKNSFLENGSASYAGMLSL